MLWIDRHAARARFDGGHAHVLQESEAALALIRRHVHGEVTHMGAAVFHLRTHGMEQLAKRLRKLSKTTNLVAHPDPSFVADLEHALTTHRLPSEVGEVAAAPTIVMLDLAAEEQAAQASAPDSVGRLYHLLWCHVHMLLVAPIIDSLPTHFQ
jgi:hypothetical protein